MRTVVARSRHDEHEMDSKSGRGTAPQRTALAGTAELIARDSRIRLRIGQPCTAHWQGTNHTPHQPPDSAIKGTTGTTTRTHHRRHHRHHRYRQQQEDNKTRKRAHTRRSEQWVGPSRAPTTERV